MKKFIKFSVPFFILCMFFQVACTTTSNESHRTLQDTQIQFEQEAPFRQGTLDNGMSYVIRENGEPKNRIQLRLVVKAGSCMEDDDQKGVAHFVEHLCFNGTEHFKKSAIVDYFESIGMKYGPEINAYTDYEQTVYMMEIPADNPEILRTSLMILRDWACAVSFEEEAIDKERGIITEEWRYRTQTLGGRMDTFETPIYLRGSRFEERPVLGDMNIIKKVSRKRIIDFYKKWYRPEFMSVIAIGDINANVLEDAVKDIMKTVPASKDKIKLPEYTVPLPQKKTIDIMCDKEITIDEIYIVMRKSNNLRVEDNYAWVYFRDIFNLRCFEKTKALNSEWINAKIG
ncbi:MAG: insulinase family protein, partial [Treponema sp.]|nr:insulinase family protein [Treponema sp.]